MPLCAAFFRMESHNFSAAASAGDILPALARDFQNVDHCWGRHSNA